MAIKKVLNCAVSEEALGIVNLVKVLNRLKTQDDALDRIILEYGVTKGIRKVLKKGKAGK